MPDKAQPRTGTPQKQTSTFSTSVSTWCWAASRGVAYFREMTSISAEGRRLSDDEWTELWARYDQYRA